MVQSSLSPQFLGFKNHPSFSGNFWKPRKVEFLLSYFSLLLLVRSLYKILGTCPNISWVIKKNKISTFSEKILKLASSYFFVLFKVLFFLFFISEIRFESYQFTLYISYKLYVIHVWYMNISFIFLIVKIVKKSSKILKGLKVSVSIISLYGSF